MDNAKRISDLKNKYEKQLQVNIIKNKVDNNLLIKTGSVKEICKIFEHKQHISETIVSTNIDLIESLNINLIENSISKQEIPHILSKIYPVYHKFLNIINIIITFNKIVLRGIFDNIIDKWKNVLLTKFINI